MKYLSILTMIFFNRWNLNYVLKTMKVYTENVLNLLFTFQNNRIDVELNRRHDYREQKYQNFLMLIVSVFNTTITISTTWKYVLIKVYHDRQMFLIVVIVINHQWEPGFMLPSNTYHVILLRTNQTYQENIEGSRHN